MGVGGGPIMDISRSVVIPVVVVIGMVVVVGPHVVLTLDTVEQSGSLLPDLLLLFSPVILLLLLEILPQPKLVLIDLHIDPVVLLLLQIIDVDVDGGHAVVGSLGVPALQPEVVLAEFIVLPVVGWFVLAVVVVEYFGVGLEVLGGE